nr:PREDICTED: uncharacterized protein LOC108209510 [Daucus carota subsp. sativus]XP_017241262.1 PREDICTED: uncharacterized protein LOC108213989 isoform X1 [Daucus carota subsp. sativus]
MSYGTNACRLLARTSLADHYLLSLETLKDGFASFFVTHLFCQKMPMWYRVKCGSLAGTHKIFQRQRVAGMTTPTQSEGDLYSTANSSESLVDPIHYSLSQSLPLEERYKLDRDWKRNEAEHSYSEAKKNYELHMGLQVHNKTIRKHVADLKAGNTSLSSQAQETKSLVDNLTAYKGHLEEDRLRELLMLQWRLNGSAAELEEGKSFLNDLIDTENGGRS